MALQDSYKQDPGRGDLDFDVIVDQFYAPLFRFAMSLTRAEDEAADLVQETFLTWAEKGRQLRDPARVKAWLFTTLHRAFLRVRRRIVRFPEVEIVDTMDDLPRVEVDHVTRLDALEAVAMLSRVDEQYRGALALFYLEDYSYQEIGEVLDVPLGTVKSRIARGLNQLRRIMLRRDETPPSGKEAQ